MVFFTGTIEEEDLGEDPPPPVQGDERFGSEIKLKLLSSIHTVLLEILSVLWCVL